MSEKTPRTFKTKKPNKNQKSWNPSIKKIVRHRDKIEWIKQIFIRDCLRDTKNPKLSFCHRPGFFNQYDQYWPILKSGWYVDCDVLSLDIEKMIATMDKRCGFVEIPIHSEDKIPEIDSNWYEEDEIYSRDLRRKCYKN